MDDHELITPPETLVREAVERGDTAAALRYLDHMVAEWRRNKDYSINWIASLLSFIGRRLGQEAVEQALRDFGDRYLAARRGTNVSVPARKRAEAIARGMKANGAEVELSEDDEKIELSFRCGSGGMLIDGGAYEDERGYLTLSGPAPVTFGRETLPVYCAHCSVNNEMEGIERQGAPYTIEHPPSSPGERCIHHVYKDNSKIPASVYERVGKTKP
jgi:hypothetical protein